MKTPRAARTIAIAIGATAGAATLPPGPARAGQDHILVGLDGKAFFEAAGLRNGPPGSDAVLVLDASDPARPRVVANLPLANSVVGPPTNLGITPDGRLGLVASSVQTVQRDGGWGAQPDDKLHVIDLGADPPRLVETLAVGRQPSGLAISRRGDLALVANRAGKSVTVLRIQGTQVRPVAEVAVEDEAAAVAIAPDGRRAFVVKNLAHRIGVLAIEGERVTYDKARDMPVGIGVYNVAVTPDGRFALAANTGPNSDGNVDTVSVIDARADPPRVVDHVAVGDGPEGFAVAPDGRHAVAVLLKGTAAVHSAWSYGKEGAVVLLASQDGRWRAGPEVPAGDLPEGVVWSRDGQYVYVGNYVGKTVQVYRMQDGRLVDTGGVLALPGQPASMAAPVR